MATDRVSLARVLELHIALSWQDAVAIAESAALAQAERRRLNRGPARLDEASVFLTTAGQVDLPEFDPAPRPDGEQQLLRALLAGLAVPPELEAVAFGAPPASMLDALAMFTRPDRLRPVASVARRALDAERELPPPRPVTPTAPDTVPAPPPRPPAADAPRPPGSRTRARDTDELERLRARTRRPRTSEASRPVTAASPPRWPVARAAVVAATAVAVAAAAGLYLVPRSTGPGNARSADAATRAEGGTVPAPGADTPGTSLLRRASELVFGPSDAPSAESGRTTDIALGPARRPAARAGDTEPLAATTPGTASAPRAAADAAPSTAPPPRAAPEADEPVHSWRTSEAEPPVMTYPRMPRSAFLEGDAEPAGQYLEVLVDATGQVEHLWLRGRAGSSESAFRNNMLMAAAKAWQFVPARHHGRPVRYIIRVGLEP